MKVLIAYVGVIAVWSTTPLAIKYSVYSGEQMAPLIARTVIGLVMTMLCLAFISERIRFCRQSLAVYTASALGIVGAMSLTYYAASYVDSGVIAIMYGLSPMIASLFAVHVLGERSNGYQYAAIMLGFGGLCWIFGVEIMEGSQRWMGLLLLLGAVTCHALSGILVKRVGSAANPMAINGGALLISLPFLMLVAADADYSIVVTNETVLKATLYLGIIGSFVGFFLHFYILQKLPATTVMLIPLITPVCALMLGYLIAGEQLTVDLVIGTSFILVGMLIYFLSSSGQRRIK